MFGGVFDLFDGALARATNKVSKLGAFMDSTFDRWGEGVVYLGILWGTLELGLLAPVILTGAAMVSAFMVSYTRAKSESLGFVPGTGMANVGLAPREIRIVILTIGLHRAGLLPGFPEDTSAPGGLAYPLSASDARDLARADRRPRHHHRHPAHRRDHQPGIQPGTGVTAATWSRST